MNFRKFTFGKYKGKEICGIILSHTGYILWLLENTQFRMNELEQECFDAIALAKMNGNTEFVYPKESLAKFIKNKDMVTPFASNDDYFCIISKYNNNKIAKLFKERYDNLEYDSIPYTPRSVRNRASSMAAIGRIAFEGTEDDEFLNDASSESAFLY